MSERKPSAYISDMLKSINQVGKYTSGLSFDDFSSNFMIVEACLYKLQTGSWDMNRDGAALRKVIAIVSGNTNLTRRQSREDCATWKKRGEYYIMIQCPSFFV